MLAIGTVLLIASLITTGLQRRSMAWAHGLLLAAVGSGALALHYVVVGGHYVSVGPPASWPPYLNEPMMAVTLGLGLAVFIAGWVWGDLMLRQRPSADRASP
jgi:hypothetical protein